MRRVRLSAEKASPKSDSLHHVGILIHAIVIYPVLLAAHSEIDTMLKINKQHLQQCETTIRDNHAHFDLLGLGKNLTPRLCALVASSR